jgi:CubicO group peptidase (beta-lactamase class C family)
MRLASLLALLALAAHAQDKEKKEPPPKSIPELEQRIREVLRKHNTFAAGVAIVNRDQILWEAGIGKANVASGRDATADTLFRIGSITKGFVAVSVMMLVEEGKFTLDAPVRLLAPDVEFNNPWESTDPVRLVNVLEHTSGFDDLAVAEYASNDPAPLTLQQGLAFRPTSRTSRWKPGTGFSYCNSGPAVAARVVEHATGRRFEDFVAERIFHPLGMSTASLLLTPDLEKKLAKGYGDDGKTPVRYWHISMRPAGSINASPHEMAAWVQMHLNRGRHGGAALLRPETVERIETPGSSLSARRGIKAGYGLGNYTSDFEGLTFHGHNGGMDGYLADMSYLPEAGLGYVFMINRANGEAFSAITKLIRGYVTRDLAKPAPGPVSSLPAEKVAEWAGFYEPRNPRREDQRFLERLMDAARLSQEGGTLVRKRLFGGEARRYLPSAEAQFRFEKAQLPDRIFLRDETGARLMVAQGSVWRETPGWLLWGQIVLGALCLALMATSILFALVWIPRKFLGRLKDAPRLSVRVWPLAAALCMTGLVLILSRQDPSVIWILGNLTAYSGTLFLLSLLLPIAAVLGLVAAVLGRPPRVRRAVWLHSLLCSLAACLIAGYLGYWGLIGVMTWR